MRRAAIIGALVLAALPAHAEKLGGIPEKAKALADRGRQLQREQNYSDAIEAYKAAYVLAPSPGLLFNLAQAYRLAGDCGDAAWMYHRFLQTDPDGELKTLAQNHLDSLDKCNQTRAFRIVDPTDVPAPTAAGSAPLALAVDVASPPPNSGQRYKHAGTAFIVGGGAALVAAALFAIDAHEQASAVNAAYTGKDTKDVMAVDTRGQRDAAIATVLGVGGAIAVASGAALYGLGHHYEHAKHVAIVPHTGGAGVSMSWGF